MRVRIITEMNLETGDYEVTLRNLSHPGMGVDASLLKKILVRVLTQMTAKISAEIQPVITN